VVFHVTTHFEISFRLRQSCRPTSSEPAISLFAGCGGCVRDRVRQRFLSRSTIHQHSCRPPSLAPHLSHILWQGCASCSVCCSRQASKAGRQLVDADAHSCGLPPSRPPTPGALCGIAGGPILRRAGTFPVVATTLIRVHVHVAKLGVTARYEPWVLCTRSYECPTCMAACPVTPKFIKSYVGQDSTAFAQGRRTGM
jgi:hypothetical protein